MNEQKEHPPMNGGSYKNSKRKPKIRGGTIPNKSSSSFTTQPVVPIVVNDMTKTAPSFVTNEAKQIYNDAKDYDSTKKEYTKPKYDPSKKNEKVVAYKQNYKPDDLQNPSLRIELFDKPEKKDIPTAIYNPTELYYQNMPAIPAVIGNAPFSRKHFENMYLPSYAYANPDAIKAPIQNVMNFYPPGPLNSGHVKLDSVISNLLPGKNNKMTSNSIGERIQSYDYTRQILINSADGEYIGVDTNPKSKNLLSFIKVMDINPGYYSPINNNPYRGMACNILIYRSAYPIEFDQKSRTTKPAKKSISLNIRFYALSCAELFVYKEQDQLAEEYDVWREIYFYEYMREHVIKKRVSPNFPLLYAYFLSDSPEADFFRINKPQTQAEYLVKYYKKLQEKIDIEVEGEEKINDSNSNNTYEIINKKLQKLNGKCPLLIGKTSTVLPDEIFPSLKRYSCTTLVAITESPNSNLYQWSSRMYENYGIVQKMTSRGYHTEDVWMGILFQIVSALYVLQLEGIYIRDMTIEDNVFIKDIGDYSKQNGYWSYIIDGITYYIPNNGYLVMIDTNFKDIIPSSSSSNVAKHYKIYDTNMGLKKLSIDAIKRGVYDNYKNIINPNSFTREHTLNGVTKPPESIIYLLTKMHSNKEQNLGKVISEYFRTFMNNRIGTYLKKIEIDNVRDKAIKNPSRGDIVPQLVADDTYVWVMIENAAKPEKIKILTKNYESSNSCEIIKATTRSDSLKTYSVTEKIDQETKLGIIFSDENLIETYTIN
jgi:hypothetical protein